MPRRDVRKAPRARPNRVAEDLDSSTGMFAKQRVTPLAATSTYGNWPDIAHNELRCGLGMVLGFGELLATDGYDQLDARQRVWVDHILTQGHRVMELVDATVVLAQGENQVSRSPVRVGDLVQHVLRGSEWEAATLGHTLSSTYDLLSPSGRALIDHKLMSSVVRGSLCSVMQAARKGSVIQAHLHENESTFELTYTVDNEETVRASAFSTLLQMSWRQVMSQHGGTIQIGLDPLCVHIAIPK